MPLCLVMCAYPTNVVCPPPQMAMTVQRIVGLVLLARCIFTREVRQQFKWHLVDTAGAVYFGAMMFSQCMTTAPAAAINKQAGFFISVCS